MPRAVPGKWVKARSGERTIDVALRTLRGRLGAVLHYLPLAAKKSDEDAEHVHKLRVWTRRAAAALKMYEDFLPRRRYLWLKKQLKRIRRAAGDARNCDVLIKRLTSGRTRRDGKQWLAAVQAERKEVHRAVVSVYKRLAGDNRFERKIDKSLKRIKSRRNKKSARKTKDFAAWAHTQFRLTGDRFFAAIPSDPTDEAALHNFRICGKELRYAIELLSGALPAAVRDNLYPHVEDLQDQMGRINDFATAKTWLEEKVAAANNRQEAAAWRRLLGSEQRRLRRAREYFWQRCTPRRLRRLAKDFERVLSEGPPVHDKERAER